MTELEANWMELSQEMGKLHGWDSLTSKLVGILYIEPGEIALEDLAKRTGYSLASVSNKIRQLEPFGIIQRATKPGTRKVFLSMEKDLLGSHHRHILTVARKKISLAKDRLPGILKAKGSLEQKKILQNYLKQVEKLDILLASLVGRIEGL